MPTNHMRKLVFSGLQLTQNTERLKIIVAALMLVLIVVGSVMAMNIWSGAED
jgi:hypothetical protein